MPGTSCGFSTGPVVIIIIATLLYSLCKIMRTYTIGSAPELHLLLCLKVDGKQLKLVESVAVEWKQLGLALKFNYSLLEAIETKKITCEDCCLEMLHKWLSGEACQPITWERLIEALRDLELASLAAQLEEMLSS